VLVVTALVILLLLALTCFHNTAVQIVFLEMSMGRNMTGQVCSLVDICCLMVVKLVAHNAGSSNRAAAAGRD
jgi:hypothetical protein